MVSLLNGGIYMNPDFGPSSDETVATALRKAYERRIAGKVDEVFASAGTQITTDGERTWFALDSDALDFVAKKFGWKDKEPTGFGGADC